MKSIYNDIKLAKSTGTTEEELKKLFSLEEESVQSVVLKNKNFSENMQISLATDETTPLHIMYILYKSDYVIVRNCLAANKNCPLEIIKLFFENKDALMGVASNINTPVNIIKSLLDLDNGVYQEFLSANISTPVDLLYILHTHEDSDIRINISGNTATPEKLLSVLASDLDIDVRCAVAGNRKSPKNVLKKLLEDNHPISEIAKQNIKDRRTEKEINGDLEKLLDTDLPSLNEEFMFI